MEAETAYPCGRSGGHVDALFLMLRDRLKKNKLLLYEEQTGYFTRELRKAVSRLPRDKFESMMQEKHVEEIYLLMADTSSPSLQTFTDVYFSTHPHDLSAAQKKKWLYDLYHAVQSTEVNYKEVFLKFCLLAQKKLGTQLLKECGDNYAMKRYLLLFCPGLGDVEELNSPLLEVLLGFQQMHPLRPNVLTVLLHLEVVQGRIRPSLYRRLKLEFPQSTVPTLLCRYIRRYYTPREEEELASNLSSKLPFFYDQCCDNPTLLKHYYAQKYYSTWYCEGKPEFHFMLDHSENAADTKQICSLLREEGESENVLKIPLYDF
ncbi:ORF60 [Ranid herpesvirus 2]|uniref:ORF60 n=1 Tax=Ranid herpesvirus 2 TaxID=389214 RepID=Q14W46_9VIRU|nr:ORF60 [Ranid herpesvirus 2]ABG25640.1 ORF60 [Ranid herpesvirus 2]